METSGVTVTPSPRLTVTPLGSRSETGGSHHAPHMVGSIQTEGVQIGRAGPGVSLAPLAEDPAFRLKPLERAYDSGPAHSALKGKPIEPRPCAPGLGVRSERQRHQDGLGRSLFRNFPDPFSRERRAAIVGSPSHYAADLAPSPVARGLPSIQARISSDLQATPHRPMRTGLGKSPESSNRYSPLRLIPQRRWTCSRRTRLTESFWFVLCMVGILRNLRENRNIKPAHV